MISKQKLYIVTTVPMSYIFFKGQLFILNEAFEVTLISSPEEELYSTAARYKVKSYGIKMKREISLFRDLLALLQFMLFFIYNRPDIVHGNTPKGSFLSMTASWLCGVRTRIYYVHGLRYQGAIGLKRKLLILMERFSCYFATHIIAVSNGVKNDLTADRITKKNVDVIWNGSVNGIDLEYFHSAKADLSDIRSEYGIRHNDFVFGFVGRMVSDKGINELVTCFKRLSAERNNIKLLLVGGMENDLDPLQSETITEIRNNPNIVLAGKQKDIRPYLAAMDLFVFPSYREGFGIALMEAAAMNVPAISSDITGCNEVVIHNQTGYLIPPKDEKGLFGKMDYAVNHQDKIREMSANSRAVMRNRFEQSTLWHKTMEYYRSIV